MSFRRTALFTSIGILAFVAGGWLAGRRAPDQRELFAQAQLLDRVVARVADYYVDSLDEGDLYELAVEGMLRGLGDPYAGFLEADEFDGLSLNTTGNYAGLGMRIESSGGWITVVTPLADTPAEAAGILPGDRIVMVDEASTQGWTTDDAVSLLRGDVGTPVTVVVSRPGVTEWLSFTMERAPIHVSAVRHAQLLGPGVGYVWLEIVTEESTRELRERVDALRGQGAEALILDVRFNPGGLLTQGIELADLFLDEGDVVVETRGRNPSSARVYRADQAERWPGMPVVVLVNEFSASAAEIIAGALQDNDRALVLGVPSFGKGLVQTVFPFGDREALKLTTGRWYTPSGRSIQRPEGAVARAADSTATEDDADPEGATFHTVGGREVEGGGGIHPDVVFVDSTDAVREALVRRLGGRLQAFQDVIGAYATEMSASEALSEADIVVNDALRRELRSRADVAGITFTQEAWDRAVTYAGPELVYRILRYEIGRHAEMRRRTGDDPLVMRALDLLEQAGSIEELLEAR